MSPPRDLAGDFAMEQEVTMRHAEGENTFRAVLQKAGDRLVLLGLAPHGGRAFVLEQVGTDVRYESFMPFVLPFPPEYMLHDVHRTWFPVSDPDEDVAETRDGGRLMERRFVRRDGAPSGAITVRYEGGLAPNAPLRERPPDVAVIENGWFGYTATVRTLSWQQL